MFNMGLVLFADLIEFVRMVAVLYALILNYFSSNKHSIEVTLYGRVRNFLWMIFNSKKSFYVSATGHYCS